MQGFIRHVTVGAIALHFAGAPALLAHARESASSPSTQAIWIQASNVTLNAAENVRLLKDGVLEVAAQLPPGTVLSVPKEHAPENYDYRDSKGRIQRSSNGFYAGITILQVAPEYLQDFPQPRIDALNQTPGGLFITSSVVNEYTDELIPVLQPKEPGAEFLLNFTPEGKPKAAFTDSFRKRFGDRLNLAVAWESLSSYERRKWSAIYTQLRRAGDRTTETEGALLFIDTERAREYSILFEEQGTVQTQGAWTIAVKATAPRHGFPNVPCAEFMSEVLRQAYQRAGYDFREDFNETRGNPLIWSNTAAVVNLANALASAGWIPWDSSHYKPVTGAPMMHATARTPGHAYLIAGHDGRFIMDNGSPRGRDLRATSDRIIKMMYQHGVFFLPPGILPEAW